MRPINYELLCVRSTMSYYASDQLGVIMRPINYELLMLYGFWNTLMQFISMFVCFLSSHVIANSCYR